MHNPILSCALYRLQHCSTASMIQDPNPNLDICSTWDKTAPGNRIFDELCRAHSAGKVARRIYSITKAYGARFIIEKHNGYHPITNSSALSKIRRHVRAATGRGDRCFLHADVLQVAQYCLDRLQELWIHPQQEKSQVESPEDNKNTNDDIEQPDWDRDIVLSGKHRRRQPDSIGNQFFRELCVAHQSLYRFKGKLVTCHRLACIVQGYGGRFWNGHQLLTLPTQVEDAIWKGVRHRLKQNIIQQDPDALKYAVPNVAVAICHCRERLQELKGMTVEQCMTEQQQKCMYQPQQPQLARSVVETSACRPVLPQSIDREVAWIAGNPLEEACCRLDVHGNVIDPSGAALFAVLVSRQDDPAISDILKKAPSPTSVQQIIFEQA